jgi:Ca2+/Na+ antiporter
MKKHNFFMLLCCLIPLFLLFILFTLKIQIRGILFLAVLILCPLMHIFMMKGMHEDSDNSLSHNRHQENNKKLQDKTKN